MGDAAGIRGSARGLPHTRSRAGLRPRSTRRPVPAGGWRALHASPARGCISALRRRRPDHLIAAGVLHDVIEKTGVAGSELRKRFGTRIATLVLAVREDEHLAGYTAPKAALRDQVAKAGDEALALFAADKVSKARELRLGGAGVHRSRRRRLAHYQRCLAILQEHLPGSPLVAQLRAELDESAPKNEQARERV